MSKTVKKIMDNDFIIRIRPFLDENDEWTGEIDLSIMTQPGNILTEDDHFQLMHFFVCQDFLASFPALFTPFHLYFLCPAALMFFRHEK